MNIKSKSIAELREICKNQNIKGFSGKSKYDLIKLLEDPSIEQDTSKISDIILIDLIDKVSFGDCLELMKKIPANSIDMVCTDPPYFLDGLGADWSKESLDSKGSSAVVGNLPKGMRFDRSQSKRFNEFYGKVSSKIFRI